MLHPGRDQSTNFLSIGHNDTHSSGSWEASNSGFWTSKPGQNRRNCRSWNDMEVQFGTESKEVDDSGICSPPLWTTSPPRSPLHRKNHYRSLSPASRTQAVARGQRELMEMVRNMPESSYELSLKDLVERPRVDVREENTVAERNLNNRKGYKREGSIRKVDKKGQVKRSGNIDSGGFYLKMVFPTSLGSKKKKKSESLANSSSKVSPRPSVSDGSAKGVDKEWWKKSLSSSVKSDSGVSSINSGSMKSSGSSSSSIISRSNSRHENRGGGCWPFIPIPKRLWQKWV